MNKISIYIKIEEKYSYTDEKYSYQKLYKITDTST